jgi:hypothetical protein
MKYFVTFTCALGIVLLHAQEGTTRNGGQLDVYLLGGGSGQAYYSPTLGDWRRMFPSSMILQGDVLSDRVPMYDHYYPFFPHGMGGSFHLGAGFGVGRGTSEEVRTAHKVRVGATYLGRSSMWRQWSRSERGPYDVLTSQLTGEEFPLDTVFIESRSAYASYSRIGLDLLYVGEIRTRSRWHFQVGAGVIGGLLIGEEGVLEHSVARTIANRPYSSYSSWGEVEYRRVLAEERFQVPDRFFFGLQALVGVDYQLGRTHPFWSALMLHYEMRPTLMFGDGFGSSSATPSMQHLFGLRFNFR